MWELTYYKINIVKLVCDTFIHLTTFLLPLYVYIQNKGLIKTDLVGPVCGMDYRFYVEDKYAGNGAISFTPTECTVSVKLYPHWCYLCIFVLSVKTGIGDTNPRDVGLMYFSNDYNKRSFSLFQSYYKLHITIGTSIVAHC